MVISQDIIEELTEGNQEAFRTVFKAAYPQVRAFTMGFIKNNADADDIAQQVFIKLWTKRAILANVRNFETYLYTITKNTVLNHMASQKAFTIDISNIRDLSTSTDSPLEQIEANDQADKLYDLLEKTGKMTRKIPLKQSVPVTDNTLINKRWKIIENYKIEIDEI